MITRQVFIFLFVFVFVAMTKFPFPAKSAMSKVPDWSLWGPLLPPSYSVNEKINYDRTKATIFLPKSFSFKKERRVHVLPLPLPLPREAAFDFKSGTIGKLSVMTIPNLVGG